MIYLPTTRAVPGKSGLILMARILGANRQAITQATLTSITYTVTDITTGLAIATAQALTIGNVVFDNLVKTDPTWDADSQDNPSLEDGLWGYNFKTTIPALSLVPSGDRFQVDIVFTPTTGERFTVSVSVPTVRNYV